MKGMSFSQLRKKDVINVCDGHRLGRPIDLVFNERAVVEAIIVPLPNTFSGMFSKERPGFVVPWSNIKRFGDDVILVEIDPQELNR